MTYHNFNEEMESENSRHEYENKICLKECLKSKILKLLYQCKLKGRCVRGYSRKGCK
jgi:hypothetical protein